MPSINYNKISLNDVPLDVFLRYFSQESYGDVPNTPSMIDMTAKPYKYRGRIAVPMDLKAFMDKYMAKRYYANRVSDVEGALKDRNWAVAASYSLYLQGIEKESLQNIEKDFGAAKRGTDGPWPVYLFPLPTSMCSYTDPNSNDTFLSVCVDKWFTELGATESMKPLRKASQRDTHIPLATYKTYAPRILLAAMKITPEGHPNGLHILKKVSENPTIIDGYIAARDASSTHLRVNKTFFPDFEGLAPYESVGWLGNDEGTCTENANNFFYILVTTRPYRIPEQDEAGNNIYIDQDGVRTLKATYANTFSVHQEALRRAMAKLTPSDGWMYDKNANSLCLLRKGDKHRLASYTTIRRKDVYTMASQSEQEDLMDGTLAYSSQMLPKALVDGVKADGSLTKYEDEKLEHLYGYLEDYPHFICYADHKPYGYDGVNPTEIRCPQLEDEAVTEEGFNAILEVHQRFLAFEDGTKIPLNKDDTVSLRIKIGGVSLNKGNAMSVPVFNVGGKPFFVLGLCIKSSADLAKLSSVKVEISYEGGTAPLEGSFSQMATQNASGLTLSIPALTAQPIGLTVGEELGLSDGEMADLKAYFGEDISKVYFLKIQAPSRTIIGPKIQTLYVHIRKNKK